MKLVFDGLNALDNCNIAGNDAADTLAKKGSTIIQQCQSSISYHSAKISIKSHFKYITLMDLTCRTEGNAVYSEDPPNMNDKGKLED